MSVSQVVGLCILLFVVISIIVFDIIITISNFRCYKKIVGKKFINYFFCNNVVSFYITDSNLKKFEKFSKKDIFNISLIINDALKTYEG